MAIDTHIQQLEEKHRELDNQLSQMMTYPGTADTEIAEMKRQKLHLKDRISQLRNEASQH